MDIDQLRINSYVKKTLKAGFSEDSIRSILRLKGHSEEKINRAFGIVRKAPAPSPEPAAKQEKARSPRLKPNIVISVGILIVVVLVALFMVLARYNILPGPGCSTIDCFVSAANQCSEAHYANDLEGTKILAEVKECVLTISISSLAADEPQELKDLFEDTSMACPYEKGTFDSSMAGENLGAWVEGCEGTLKDAIDLLKAAAALAAE